MTNLQQAKIKMSLVEAINECFEKDIYDDLNCWYGENMAERMADAAFAVLAATKEAQELMAKDNLEVLK